MRQWFKEHLSAIFLGIFTIIYLALILDFMSFDVFKKLALNEKGDFLAGIFSPLAFTWLVYGYLQQGSELKQNNQAIRLQAEELKNSVEQQKELVKANNIEIELIKERENRQIKLETIQAQPFFHFQIHKFSLMSVFNKAENLEITKILLEFSNSRAICRKLQISHNFQAMRYSVPITEVDLIKNNEDVIYSVDIDLNPEFDTKTIDLIIYLKFSYLDLYDDKQIQIFRFRLRKRQKEGDTIFSNYTTISQIENTYRN